MYSAVKTYLKETLKGELPGFRAHSKMLPPGRRLKTMEEERSMVKLKQCSVVAFP